MPIGLKQRRAAPPAVLAFVGFVSATLSAQNAQIRGTVVDYNGKPFSVRISLLHAGSSEQVMSATGSGFTFDGVATGQYDVRVERYMFVSATVRAIAIHEGARLQLPPIRLDLTSKVCAEERDFVRASDDGAGIAGRVTDQSHDPVANAQVIAFRNHSRAGLGETGADGTFSIRNLDPGIYAIVVQAKGFYTEDLDRVRAMSGYSSQLPPIELESCRDAQCSSGLKTIKIEGGCDIPDL